MVPVTRDDLVAIMAGYKGMMDALFSDVPGLSSRIGRFANARSVRDLVTITADDVRARPERQPVTGRKATSPTR